MASRAQLVRMILKELGVYQAGQDLPAEDYAAVNEDLPMHLLAMTRAHIYTASVDNIPDEAAPNIAKYLAKEFVQTFGIAGEEKAEIRQAAGEAEMALRYLRTMGPTYSVLPGTYF